MTRHFGITNRPMAGGSTSTGSSGADTRANSACSAVDMDGVTPSPASKSTVPATRSLGTRGKIDQASNSFADTGSYSPSCSVNLRGDGFTPSFIPGSILIPPDPPFKRSRFTQALIDSAMVIFGLFFLCALAGSLPLAIFVMLF